MTTDQFNALSKRQQVIFTATKERGEVMGHHQGACWIQWGKEKRIGTVTDPAMVELGRGRRSQSRLP